MDRNITLKVAEKTFEMSAKTPEMEQSMRLAAEDVNKLLTYFHQKYSDKPLEDKLALVSVAESIQKITSVSKLKRVEDELSQLKDELAGYLAGK